MSARPSIFATRLVRTLAIVCGVLVGVADAQAQPDDRERAAQRERRHEGRGMRWGGPLAGHDVAKRLFRLAPTDRGPLREGEAEELLEFTERCIPRLHAALLSLRENDPEQFRRTLEEHAPRLRQMKRVYELSPELGDLIREHTKNEFHLRRVAHRLQRIGTDSWRSNRFQRRARELIADNARLEIKTLQTVVTKLEEHRDERIAARVDYVLEQDTDLSEYPARLQELRDAYQSAEDDELRTRIRDHLTTLAGQQIDRELDEYRTRIKTMRADLSDEIETRVKRFRERVENHEPRGRGRWHGNRERE